MSRRTVLRAAGAIGLVAAGAGVLALAEASPASARQPEWAWCRYCEALWFPPNGGGSCPAPGRRETGHSNDRSGNYTVKFSWEQGAGQDRWFFCHWCGVLHFVALVPGGGDVRGVCPSPFNGSGRHETYESEMYRVELTTSRDGPGGQSDWRWCNRCKELWFNGNPGNGICPAVGDGETRHRIAGSGDYILRFA